MNNFIFNIASWDYPEELQDNTDVIFEFRLIYLAYKSLYLTWFTIFLRMLKSMSLM